jgi:putative ABC transport system permease protein
MKLGNIIKIAISALMRNKTRAMLTMLGIIIGIASVIAMVSIGQSSTMGITQEMSSMGSNMIFVSPGSQQRGPFSAGSGTAENLTAKDAEALKKSPYIAAVSPSVSAAGQLINGSNNWRGTVTGGSADIIAIRNFNLEAGIMFTDFDVRTSAKVCVIGKTVQQKLFPNGENPIGKTIRFNNIPLKIIGILESKGQNTMGQDQDDVVFTPYTTVQKRVLAITHVQMIMMSAIDEASVDLAMTDAERILKINVGSGDFEIRSQKEMLNMMSSVTGMLTMLLAAIASISLIVGGIGIMNIMYVTVTERTKEIGLRMSIGAPNRSILMQFLAESTMLSLVGGVIGIIIGLSLSFAVSALLGFPFVISTTAIVASFLVCVATGIFFGWYPAKKASKLDPIVALRYE